ncbi:MAG TPA: hypothetical protein VK427_24710, partial [Kofleriaceae bacterium]|nr:hypothetical protein [Kofleriaceae bacterium]
RSRDTRGIGFALGNGMMKTRRAFGAAFVVTVANVGGGCGVSNPPPPDVSNPPAPGVRVASYDVLVSSEVVYLLPQYVTTDPSCNPFGVTQVPVIGACLDEGDVQWFPCGDAKTSIVQVSVDGVTATPQARTASIGLAVQSQPSSTLIVDGPQGSIEIPLHATALPTPTITTMESATGYDIRWTTDFPATSALVDVTAGLGVKHCHVTSQSYEYVDPPKVIGVRVQALRELETHATPYGELRIWRGNGKYHSF